MTINALLDAATERERLRPSDARSGATFERFRVGGRRYFTERVRPECDWIMRVTGDRDFRTAKAWHAGLLRRAAAAVVHAVLDVAVVDGELAVLMDDVDDRLGTPGPRPSPPRWPARPRRSCTATRRWATSACPPTVARSCWTGPTRAPGPRPGSSGGTWR